MSEQLEFDVIIVGAGPAGLSAAIRLKQLSLSDPKPLRVCVLEKGSEVGAHILSGAVIETRALDELLPDWQQRGAPIHTLVSEDQFYLLTSHKAWRLPTPPQMKNHGNYIVSLADVCRWLARQAESLGVEIYPGFAVSECLFNDNQETVIGIKTAPVGLDKSGQRTERYEDGVSIYAKHVLLGEGCRGSLSEQIIQHFNLRQAAQSQTYAIGIKELWEIKPEHHHAGRVTHTIGWPMDYKTYGGSFIYHLTDQQIAIGLVVGLDYQNPYLSPFNEMQRFKHHPLVASLLQGGRRISYGARALNEGGWQSIPRLDFKGGSLIGCAAGFLNVPKIKGSHTAMKSGMIAAEHIYESINHPDDHRPLELNNRIRSSWIGHELKQVRNIRPGFKWGLFPGLINAAFETYLWRGKAPWTLSHHVDHLQLQPARQCQKILYPQPDGKISFDRLSSVFLSNTNHNENQPCHLVLKDDTVPIDINLSVYDAPEQRYCPAGVYEIIRDDQNQQKLQINAQNCIHCKTCDIKDPTQNIIWKTPEGGGGPNYSGM